MVNDTISDMLTRIRNANMAKHSLVEVPSTKMTRNITAILKEEGFIEDSKEVANGIKPGVRTYAGSKNIPSVLGNLGIAILSTSKGVITDTQARQLKVGGEVLCYIW